MATFVIEINNLFAPLIQCAFNTKRTHNLPFTPPFLKVVQKAIVTQSFAAQKRNYAKGINFDYGKGHTIPKFTFLFYTRQSTLSICF